MTITINNVKQFAPAWDDLRVAANNTRINPATSKPDYTTFINGTLTFLFDASSVESVHFAVQIPHAHKKGTAIRPHVHWTSTTTNVGTVLWGFEYTISDIHSVFPTTTTINSISISTTGTAYEHQISEFPEINMTNYPQVSTMLICRLFRNATADSYNADVAFLEFDFHYQIDTLGSDQEYSKSFN